MAASACKRRITLRSETQKPAIGGLNETAATTLFAIVFLICLIKAYLHIRRKEVMRHREWMIRAFGVGLGVATTRPIVGMFFAFRKLTPHEFFGIAFWLGFTITFLAARSLGRLHAATRGGRRTAAEIDG
jgi:ABC-type transporter Mla maintaining outer membrane lipid asymmetry permease subunit MlaE